MSGIKIIEGGNGPTIESIINSIGNFNNPPEALQLLTQKARESLVNSPYILRDLSLRCMYSSMEFLVWDSLGAIGHKCLVREYIFN